MKLREPWTCIFCNNFGVSDEHFWPIWCHHLFKRGAHDGFVQFRDDKIPGEAKRNNRRNHHGHIVTKTIHCVCKKCNNGWMSQIEAAAKPVMLPLMRGERCTITTDQRRALANWIALKVMVSEHDERGYAVTPDHDRLVFYEFRGIPRYYRIRIGYNDSGWNVGFYRQSITMSVSKVAPTQTAPHPSPPLGLLRKNVHCVSILMGKLFIHATAARVDDFDLDNVIVHQGWGPRLWPHEDGEIAWPPAKALAKRNVSTLSRSLEYPEQQPRYRWGGFLPGEKEKWDAGE